MLNIKNKETYRLAKELAHLRGKTMTAVITEALQKEIDATQKKLIKNKALQREKILELADKLSAGIRAVDPDFDSKKAQDALYDENGIPC